MRDNSGLAVSGALLILLASCAAREQRAQIDCTKDDQCPPGHLCNRMTNVCYPTEPAGDGGAGDASGVERPPLVSAARGTFSCPIYESMPSNAAGTMDIHLELEGTIYWFNFACGCYETSAYQWCELHGYDAAMEKEAVVALNMRKEALAAAEFAVPEQIYGHVNTGPANGPWEPRAMVWGGTVTFDQAGPAALAGALDVSLEPIRPKPFGGVCRLKRACDAECELKADERISPDCDFTADCIPLWDGTSRGVCTAWCEGDEDCQKHYADTKCLGAATRLCFKTCADASQCEAPLTCAMPDAVCKVQ